MKFQPDSTKDGLPSYSIRPGIAFPDWSVVRSPVAREALLAIFEVFDMDRCWGGYTEAEDAVRTAILLHYCKNGKPPAVADLMSSCGMDEAQVMTSLRNLKGRDLVVLDDARGQVTGAYPFTDRETGHRVRLGDTEVNAMCAVDALGAGAMYGSDTEIDSSCRLCGAPIHVATHRAGRAIRQVSPPETVVWTGIQYGGQAATSLCTVIAFFCSEDHLNGWRGNNSEERGFRMSLDEGMETGMAIFMPFLAGSDRHGAPDGQVVAAQPGIGSR